MSEQKELSGILEEWEALANAATQGPWQKGDGVNDSGAVVLSGRKPICSTEMAHAPSGTQQINNVKFISGQRRIRLRELR